MTGVDEKISAMADVLTSILGCEQLLLDGAFGSLSADQKDILAMLRTRSERLRTLFREICSGAILYVPPPEIGGTTEFSPPPTIPKPSLPKRPREGLA